MRETTQNLPTTIHISYKTIIEMELHSKNQIYSNTKKLRAKEKKNMISYLVHFLCNKTEINQQEK